MRRRPGFTLIELLIVIVLVATISAAAVPRISQLRRQSAMASARQQLASSIAAARAAAVQRGTRANLRIRNGVLTVWVLDGTDSVQAIPRTNFQTEFGLTLAGATAADSGITFDSHGFASPRLTQGMRLRLTKGAHSDSLCLSNFGQILPRGCQL